MPHHKHIVSIFMNACFFAWLKGHFRLISSVVIYKDYNVAYWLWDEDKNLRSEDQDDTNPLLDETFTWNISLKIWFEY